MASLTWQKSEPDRRGERRRKLYQPERYFLVLAWEILVVATGHLSAILQKLMGIGEWFL